MKCPGTWHLLHRYVGGGFKPEPAGGGKIILDIFKLDETTDKSSHLMTFITVQPRFCNEKFVQTLKQME
jgi:hypothetical protein